jgi:molybdenum cofactor biosynthesis enzyme MoaA
MPTNYRTLRILLHSECSLSCFYCCSEGYKSTYSILNSNNIAMCIKEAIESFQIERVKITGGEPFLCKDIHSIIETISRINTLRRISIVTNGLDSKGLIRALGINQDIDVTISVPSIDPGTYHAMTGGTPDSLNAVLASAESLSRNGTEFKINCVVAKDVNTSCIKQSIDYFKALKGAKIRFLQLCTNNVNRNTQIINREVASTQFSEYMKQIGFTLLDSSREEIRYRDDDDYYTKYILSFCSDDCTECPASKTSLWLTPDGFITNCIRSGKRHKITEWTPHSVRTAFLKFNPAPL